ncbi:MAG: hypothetical protein N2Z22_10995, partial [Turneriella sp.]|nr:hypothetical protein [Turneriella sp.]
MGTQEVLRSADLQALRQRLAELQNFAIAIYARIRYSRTWWYSGAAVLLALALARLSHSVALFYVTKN